jgi:hypothetical protein
MFPPRDDGECATVYLFRSTSNESVPARRGSIVQRRTPTVSDLVRRAVEVCDPDGTDAALGRLQQQLEDDDEPITAVENLEERLALALEGADYDAENPAVAVASAIVLYLAAHRGEADFDRDPQELVRLSVLAQWRGDVPTFVEDWLALR